MVLDVEAGLAAFAPALEGWEDVGVSARFEEEAFAFAQLYEVDSGFEEVTAPGVREVAFDAEGEARARGVRKRRDGIGGRQNAIGTVARVERRVQQGVR